jgi:hypothetical protein
LQLRNLEFASLIDTRKLADFVMAHHNSDGGYSFLRPLYGVEFPSSISETYYALAILSMLGERIPRREKTAEFVKSMQEPDGTFRSAEVAFYTVKSIRLLNEELPSTTFAEQLYQLLSMQRMTHEAAGPGHFSSDYDVTGSPFMETYCTAAALHFSGLPVYLKDVAWLADQEKNGGFGVERPDIASTYYALGTLLYAGYPKEKAYRVTGFAEKCAVAEGGYASIPYGAPAFLESTYFASTILYLIEQSPREPRKHVRFVCRLQNRNGGFRRSSAMGISTLCNSYFAVKSLETLSGGSAEEKTRL